MIFAFIKAIITLIIHKTYATSVNRLQATDGLESSQIQILENHGCHCSRLVASAYGHQQGFLAASEVIDVVDQYCKDWLAATHQRIL